MADTSIEAHGWKGIAISDTWPAFEYTVGLSKTFAHPEIIVFGLPASSSHSILAALVQRLRQGKRFDRAGKYLDFWQPAGFKIKLVHESWHSTYLGYAMEFVRENDLGDLKTVQLLWPDAQDRMPDELECDLKVRTAQPRLDLPMTSIGIEDRPSWP